MFQRLQELVDEAASTSHIGSDLRPTFALTPKVIRRTYACCNLISSKLLGSGQGLDLRSCWAPLTLIILAPLWVVIEGWGTKQEVSQVSDRPARSSPLPPWGAR